MIISIVIFKHVLHRLHVYALFLTALCTNLWINADEEQIIIGMVIPQVHVPVWDRYYQLIKQCTLWDWLLVCAFANNESQWMICVEQFVDRLPRWLTVIKSADKPIYTFIYLFSSTHVNNIELWYSFVILLSNRIDTRP